MDKLLRRVKGELGYPVVTIELDDENINEIIKDSMDFINEYSNNFGAITTNIESGNSIDLKNYPDIYKVVKVMDSNTKSSGGDLTPEDMVFGSTAYKRGIRYGGSITSGQCCHSVDISQVIMLNKVQDKFASSLSRELHFSVLGNTLYIPDETGSVTLIYIKKIDETNVNDEDPIVEEWIVRHASATLKKLLGKARKRYTSSKALFELDTDIYSEGEQELEKLMEELRNSDLILAELV